MTYSPCALCWPKLSPSTSVLVFGSNQPPLVLHPIGLLSPGSSVLVFGFNQPPLHASPNHTLAPPQPQRTPSQPGPLYPTISPPAIHSQKPSHEGSVSVLLWFLVNSPYFDFSTFTFYFIYTCIYIIKVTQYTILGSYSEVQSTDIGIEIELFSTQFSKIHGKKIKCSHPHLWWMESKYVFRK
jgi:hypothetical protein